MSRWTKAEVETLRHAATVEGKSPRQIATMLGNGRTREAVTDKARESGIVIGGFCERRKIVRGAVAVHPPQNRRVEGRLDLQNILHQRNQSKGRAQTGFGRGPTSTQNAPPMGRAAFAAAFQRASAVGMVTLMERRNDQCCWPYETPEGTRYCGQPVTFRQSVGMPGYCAECADRRRGTG